MYAKKSAGLGTIVASAAACAVTFAMMSSACHAALAEQPSVSPRQLHTRAVVLRADLETEFWICDYLATTHGMLAVPMDTCSAVTDELKNEKFGGHFEEMLNWWQQNKFSEHQKLESGGR